MFLRDNVKLSNNLYTLFVDDDEEVPRLLIQHLHTLEPEYPYYWVRIINLVNGKYARWLNPHFKASLVSGKVRFKGELHEKVEPRHPHGVIDIPIIHNSKPESVEDKISPAYHLHSRPSRETKIFLYMQRAKKLLEKVRRGG